MFSTLASLHFPVAPFILTGIIGLFFFVTPKSVQGQSIPPQARLSQETATASPILTGTTQSQPSSSVPIGNSNSAARDLGEQQILVMKEDIEPVLFSMSAGVFYTNNAGLTSQNEVDDWALTSTLMVNWTPRIVDKLFLDIAIREDIYRYDRLGDLLDFDSFRVTAGLGYFIPNVRDLLLTARYGLQITTFPWDWNESVFLNNTFNLGLQKTFALSKGNQFVVGLSSEIALETKPSMLRRNEYVFQVAHQVRWTPTIDTMLTYRCAYNDYRALEGLTAWNHMTAFRVAYRPTEWLSTGINAAYVWNDANKPGFDYRLGIFGVSVDVTIRF